jgi:outer membrane immunogenic protein
VKKIILAATAALAIPSAANAQAYVQIQTGFDSVSVWGGSKEGIAYGVAAGYDFSLGGNMFAGVEVSLDDSSTKRCDSYGSEKECLKTGRDLSPVVRLGAKLGEKGKLYALAGYTNARAKYTYTDGSYSEAEAGNLDGLRLGAGYQHDFGGNFFGKLEYRYSNYEADFSRHNALIGAGIKF